ncbi:MAG: hypothetical protein ACYC99_07790 [Candidatus Geothermincolia bacterium]
MEMNAEARRAAFELAFGNRRAPLDSDAWAGEELTAKVRERAVTTSGDEIRDILSRVRRLSDDAYEICDSFREGVYGEGAPGRKAAVLQLSRRDPGFELAEYEAAFATGLFWTAF